MPAIRRNINSLATAEKRESARMRRALSPKYTTPIMHAGSKAMHTRCIIFLVEFALLTCGESDHISKL